jgi:hypothetical protein
MYTPHKESLTDNKTFTAHHIHHQPVLRQGELITRHGKRSNWVAARGRISKHEPRDHVAYLLVSPSCTCRGEGHGKTDLTSLADEAKPKLG